MCRSCLFFFYLFSPDSHHYMAIVLYTNSLSDDMNPTEKFPLADGLIFLSTGGVCVGGESAHELALVLHEHCALAVGRFLVRRPSIPSKARLASS